MTNFEKLVVSACTGTIMTSENEFLEFAEMTLGRPILAEELENDMFWAEIKENLKIVFSNICKSETPDVEISLEDDAIMEFYPLIEVINSYAKQTFAVVKLLQTYTNAYSRILSEHNVENNSI